MKPCTARVIASTLVVMLWSSSLLAAPSYFAGTGHYYEYVPYSDLVPDAEYWRSARELALNSSHLGRQGYLATITDSEENAFISDLVGHSRAGWIGGTDEPHEGKWVWADGPEAEEVFWNGDSNGSSPTYSSWAPARPGGNDFAGVAYQTYSNETFGKWDSWGLFHSFRPMGYVVEYSYNQRDFIDVNPWSTHLKVLDAQDIDYDEDEFGLHLDAKIIDLANELSFTVQPGDYLRLQRFGDFDFASSPEEDTSGPHGNGTLRSLWGVFSSNDTLGPKTDMNRVPGAAPLLAGNAPKLNTPAGDDGNDIEYDFIIDDGGGLLDPEGVLVRVPEGATHLFVGAGDEVWFDNRHTSSGGFGLKITLLDPAQFIGDANGDGLVDGLDYLIWAGNFGDNPADDPPGSPENGDFNGDGVVDGTDYLVWAENYGQGPNDGVAVPEPTAMCIALFGLATLLVTPQRRCRP